MSFLKSKQLKYDIPCTFHTISDIKIPCARNNLPEFNAQGVLVKEARKPATVKMEGFPTAQAYIDGEAPTSVEIIEVPMSVALRCMRQKLKTPEEFFEDWLQANVAFYSDAQRVAG
jgi:hypothetical protein